MKMLSGKNIGKIYDSGKIEKLKILENFEKLKKIFFIVEKLLFKRQNQ
jgi:hypothetical protein